MGEVKDNLGRLSRAEAAPLVDAVVAHLRDLEVDHELVGSWRRGDPEVGDLDILILDETTNELVWTSEFRPTRMGALLGSLVFWEQMQVDLWAVVQPELSLGAFLWFATGPMSLNVTMRSVALRRKLKLSQYGVFDAKGDQIDDGTEKGVAEVLGMPWIEPTERTNWKAHWR